MSQPLVNFYRGNYTSAQLLTLCQTAGNIVFDSSTSRIYAGTTGSGANEKPKVYGSNVTDASFLNNVLTINLLNSNTPITLDFSDIASASQTMAVFNKLETIIGSLNNDKTAPNYGGDTILSGKTNLVDADKALADKVRAIKDSVGLGSDYTYSSSKPRLTNVTNVSTAIDTLSDAIDEAGKVDDVKINNTSVVTGKIADIAVDGTYNSSSNKIATVTTVSNHISSLDVNGYAAAAISTSNNTLVIYGVKETDGKIEKDTTNNLTVYIDGTHSSSNKLATQTTVANYVNSLDVTTDKGAAVISGSTLTIKAVQQEDGLIKDGGTTTINLDGSYNATTNKLATQTTVSNAINNLDGSATIATVISGVVTLKAGVTETDGIISNSSGTDITLKKVATTGAAADIIITDSGSHTEQTNVEDALSEIYTSIEALEGSFDVIISTNAATTPSGVKWMDNQTEITGTLAPSDNTWHKIYLVPSGSGKDNYQEYITLRTGTNPYTYSWEKLGNTSIDLIGYAKTVTVNGKTYSVDSDSTNITLTDLITSITGETAISGGDSTLVAVTATTTKNTTNGTNSTVIASSVKIEEVADGIVKDGTASYTSGHYVIKNNKLVSAVGETTGDTYTISSNDGMVKASDVKAYVDSAIKDASFRWSEWV